jgi:hypothetical protein
MSVQMAIWLTIVALVSVAMVLGILALNNRINALDERLFGLGRLEIALNGGFDTATTNESSELAAIKLHLYELQRLQSEILEKLSLLSDAIDTGGGPLKGRKEAEDSSKLQRKSGT